MHVCHLGKYAWGLPEITHKWVPHENLRMWAFFNRTNREFSFIRWNRSFRKIRLWFTTHYLFVAAYGLNVNLCGPAQEVALKESNISTVATVSFDPDVPLGLCVLRVTAPSTHLVYLKFVETTTELYRARTFNETSYTPPCPLSIVSLYWKC